MYDIGCLFFVILHCNYYRLVKILRLGSGRLGSDIFRLSFCGSGFGLQVCLYCLVKCNIRTRVMTNVSFVT